MRGEATRRAIRGTWAMSVPMERAGKENGRRRGGGIGYVGRSWCWRYALFDVNSNLDATRGPKP